MELSRGVASPPAVDRVKLACDIAAYVGAPVVRLALRQPAHANASTTPASQQGRVAGLFRRVFGERTGNHKREWSDLMWSLRSCADYAGDRGVTLAVQNGGESAGIPHGPAIWQAVRDVGSPWLRGCIDPAALSTTTGIDLAIAHTVLVRALIRTVRDDGADTAFYWPEALRTLRLGGYRGPIVLDYAGPEAVETALPRSARYTRGLLQLLQRQGQIDVSTAVTNGASPHDAAQIVRDAARPQNATEASRRR
jgi:hypothetical protein